ncbi:MAG: 3,4-dehydroadipyl-CoA semialdehyde dehydrogenase [Myxococcota bacterium]|nr:3,4-dehydroadipyl-CoA semialdehyde dehydrogenase [Myxococcota bacterium]
MIAVTSYVGGRWIDGGRTVARLVNPATEEPVAEVRAGGIDFDEVLRFARERGGPALRAMRFAERAALLEAASKALHAVRDALLEASIVNGGATRADAKFDVDGAVGTLAYYSGVGRRLGDGRFLVEGEGEALGRGARFWGRHVRLPLTGVAIHINAFNFPAWGLAEKAAVALLAGVPVVVKPATSTALVAWRCMQRIVEAAGLPEGAMQLVCGPIDGLLERLGPHDAIAFTGSAATAAHLRALPAVTRLGTRLNVEADSLNAFVLGPDVEPGSETWSMFVRDAVREMTQKTGQKCTAVRRILVPRARLDEVGSALGEELRAVRIGNPALDEVRMGPLATASQLADFREGVRRLEASGARLLLGGTERPQVVGVPEGRGFFVAPTLLRADRPREALAVHEHEVFGPCATLMPFEDVEDAIALVALGRGGLVASAYTDDRELVEQLLLGLGPWHGRLFVGSARIADQAISPGTVLPSCVHGGPGRAGGGEELGGERALAFYTQRVAVQGDRALIERLVGARNEA